MKQYSANPLIQMCVVCPSLQVVLNFSNLQYYCKLLKSMDQSTSTMHAVEHFSQSPLVQVH